jgi:hypothetical protein
MVAWVLCLPLGTLSGWNQGFDEQMRPYRMVDKRGTCGKVTIEIVRQVVELAKDFRDRDKRLRIKGFTRAVNQELGLSLSRKTIQEILIANDLWKTETRRRRPRFYRNLCQRIPNGLLSLDGSEFVVWIDDQVVKFNVELGVDVGSFCHTGFGIHPTETAEAVIEVLEQHRRDFGTALGVVFDHGSANLSEQVRTYLEAHEIETVPAGPGNPKGNGTDEGAFSQMKQTIGAIRLETSSRQSLAKSVLHMMISLYVKMRNRMALRKNEATPLVKMRAPVSERQREKEHQRLLDHKASKNTAQTNQPKLDRLHWVIREHRLEPEAPELERARQCIRHYDLEAIAKSEEAFLKAVNRDPSRRRLAYFFGVVRNIQQQIDDQRYQDYCRERYNHEVMIELERSRQEQQLRATPTIENIVEIAITAVTSPVNYLKEKALKWCRQWTEELCKSVSYVGALKKKIVDLIGAQNHLDEFHKEQVWELIEQFLTPKLEAEGVTLVS